MPLIRPAAPPYDPLEWRTWPWRRRLRASCEAWAVQGYGAPLAVYALYLLKIAAYVLGWCWVCSFTPGLGDPRALASWWSHPVAFQKAVLWSLAWEGLGLGCASGPLTARYLPPFGGCLYWLRRGTLKLPLIAGLPLLGGRRRTWLDVALTAGHYALLARALLAPVPTPALLWPIVIGLGVLALADRTLFLAARGEHYHTTLVCFVLAPDWVAGAACVQLALWWWAGVSKLNHHFPAVVGVMTSNSPALPFRWLRRRMYRAYPDDLRPSRLAAAAGHLGTALELTVPVLLAVGQGGPVTLIGLALMLALHAFITSNVPMAVPLEWNVHVVYGALFLFGHHAAVRPWELGSPLLAGYLLVLLVAVPLYGNLRPSRVSFLMAMRYYAGNWAFSAWLFRRVGAPHRKLERLPAWSRWIPDQLALFYDEPTVLALTSKVPAFRAMHLHGRMLGELLPRAVDDPDAYELIDGELVAGMLLGWNFGDGHLHDERLLTAVQEACGFEEGELVCCFVESQPLGGDALAWRIVDAATGERARGSTEIRTLRARQPWGDPAELT